MKKNIKILSMVLIIFLIMICKSEVKAASATVSADKSSITLGETVTITTTINAASWDISLGGAISQGYADTTDDAENATKTYTYSFKPTEAGTYTINLSGNATDSTSSAATPVSDKVTINVSQTNTGSTSGGSSTNPQTPTQPTTTSNNTTKSNNANLGNFGIRPNDFTGFTPSKTEYSTTVPNNVTSIEVYATKGQSGQTITGTGTKELQEGENTFKVVVTAENGTTQKTYTLTVTREAVAEENSEETPEVGATELTEGFGLSNLEIEGVELSPRFSTDVYEYTAKYTGDANQLNIKTTPTEEGTNVEITGNENIVDGENLITILVTDSSGDKTVAYQITVQKQTIDEEAIAKQEELEKQQQMRNYIIIGGVAFLVIVIIIILIIRHRRNVRLAEEYTVPYSGLDDDDYYDDNNYDNDYDEDDYQKVTKKFLNNDKNQETTENNDKEKIKDSYLEQFDNEENDYEEERPRKKHNKGKRYR